MKNTNETIAKAWEEGMGKKLKWMKETLELWQKEAEKGIDQEYINKIQNEKHQ